MGDENEEESIQGLTGANMFELQDRTEYHMNMIKTCDARGKQAERASKIAAIAHEQIKEFGEVKTYPALGRAFVLRPLSDTLQLLEDETRANLEVVTKTKPEIKFHEDRLNQCQAELNEMMGNTRAKATSAPKEIANVN